MHSDTIQYFSTPRRRMWLWHRRTEIRHGCHHLLAHCGFDPIQSRPPHLWAVTGCQFVYNCRCAIEKLRRSMFFNSMIRLCLYPFLVVFLLCVRLSVWQTKSSPSCVLFRPFVFPPPLSFSTVCLLRSFFSPAAIFYRLPSLTHAHSPSSVAILSTLYLFLADIHPQEVSFLHPRGWWAYGYFFFLFSSASYAH